MKDELSKKTFHFLPHLIILAVGISLSFFLFFTIDAHEKQHLELEFQRIAKNRILALERLIQTKLNVLESIRAFFESSQVVEWEEFKHFTQSFSEMEDVYAVAWVPYVKDDERQQFESQAESIGMSEFFIKEKNDEGQFVPAAKREEYFPVFYVEPLEENKAVLGFDCASDSRRYQAIIEARDKNLIVASQKVHLLPDQPSIDSFLIFLPLYKNHMTSGTVQERRENFKGFIVGALQIRTIVEHAISFADVPGVSICICDLSITGKSCICCYSDGVYCMDDEFECIVDKRVPFALSSKAIIDVASRKWQVVCEPEPSLIHLYRTYHPWLTLMIGLLVTGIVHTFFLFNHRRTETLRRLVAEKTEELNGELVQRTRAEKELSKLANQLNIKNQELERVIYIASHDLRSPLVTIAGFDNELQKSCEQLKDLIDSETLDAEKKSSIHLLLDESIPESLKFIHAGVQSSEMLIDGLLQVSRAGTSPFKIEPINMNKLIKNVIESHHFQAKESDVEIKIDTLPDCLGDVAKTSQVFSNLISNALKYLSPDRPGKISVTGHSQDERSIYCVEDNGVGIPSDHRARVFRIFHRVNPKSSATGEGLGLAIVSRILEGQQGEIWLESEADVGSKFYVSLPKA